MPANTGLLLVPRSSWGCSGGRGGVPGVQAPLSPQQIVVLGDPLASAVVLSTAKGQVDKANTQKTEKKNHHMNNNPPSLGDSRDSYLDAPLS